MTEVHPNAFFLVARNSPREKIDYDSVTIKFLKLFSIRK